MLFDPHTNAIWVTSQHGQGGSVIRIDPATNRVVASVSAGCCPGAIALENGAIWVTDVATGRVSEISETAGGVIESFNVGQGVDAVAVGEGGLWVTVDPSA